MDLSIGRPRDSNATPHVGEPRPRKPRAKGAERLLVIVVAATVVLAGCAPVYVPTVGSTHPASASAPETPSPPPSRTLAGDPVLAPAHGMHGGH